MKTNISRFDSLVARYYPAVYGFAVKLTEDPRVAVALTRDAFRSCEKQLRGLHNQATIVTALMSAVIRAGLSAA